MQVRETPWARICTWPKGAATGMLKLSVTRVGWNGRHFRVWDAKPYSSLELDPRTLSML